MPRKKKTEEPKILNDSYIDAEGRRCLPPVMLWQFRALTAELEKNGLQYQKSKNEFEAYVSANTYLMECRRMMAISKAATQAGSDKIKRYKEQVELESGIDLSQCAIDDETGRIEVITDNKL